MMNLSCPLEQWRFYSQRLLRIISRCTVYSMTSIFQLVSRRTRTMGFHFRIIIWRIVLTTVLIWQVVFFVCLHGRARSSEVWADSVKHTPRGDIPDYVPKMANNWSKWPPSFLSEIQSPRSGLYDLALRPFVISKNNESRDDYLGALKLIYSGEQINGSRTKQLVMMDRAVRMGGSVPNFYLYPQVMDVIGAVKSIRSGLPVDEHPINNPELFVIQSPQFTCNHTSERATDPNGTYPLDLVILVKSCPDCSDRRTHVRSTYLQSRLWAGFRVQFAFVVGLPFIQAYQRMQYDGVDLIVRQKIVNVTQLKQARKDLFRESALYNDLLIGGFHDMYFNLTLKLIFTFRWASLFCRDQTPIFLFVDDDISANPANVISFLRRLPINGKVHFNGGMPPASQIPIRPKNRVGGSWAVSEDEFPWEQYPSYSLGAGYLVGADCVRDAAIAMAFTKFFRVDDAFLGMVWAKLNYPVLNVPGFRLRISSYMEANMTIVAYSNSMDKYLDWQTGEIRRASSKPQTKRNL